MRIALLSDIHGNATALTAVLADVEAEGGVEEYWILGDLVALGPDPVQVLDKLGRLPNARFLRGNTDRYVAGGDRPGPTLDEAAAQPHLLPALVEVAHTFAWTQGMVTAGGWLEWLRALPLELRATLPNGARLLGVHAAPGRDDGPGFLPTTPEAEATARLAGAAADLICVGHTHVPSERRLPEGHFVNLGAVSLALTPDKAASYALLEAGAEGYQVRHRRVPYDRAAVAARLRLLGHPGREFILRHLADPA